MATYSKSVVGELHGKLGKLVFFTYRGKRIVRMAPIRKKPMTIKEKNVTSAFCALTWLYREKLEPLLGLYWEKLCERKKLKMTGANLFAKYNVPPLYHSIPEPKKTWTPHNIPDFSKMLITEGNLHEPTIIYKSCYDSTKGTIYMKWDNRIFKEGNPDDKVNIVTLFCCPKPEDDKPWKSIILRTPVIKGLPDPFRPVPKPERGRDVGTGNLTKLPAKNKNHPIQRKDGELTISVEKGLYHRNLFLFFFFSNDKDCTRSVSIKFFGVQP